jgi:hypothetical protein
VPNGETLVVEGTWHETRRPDQKASDARIGVFLASPVDRCSSLCSAEFEAFQRLAGEFGDELEVLVEVEHGEVSEFGGRCDQQIGDRGRSGPPTQLDRRLRADERARTCR